MRSRVTACSAILASTTILAAGAFAQPVPSRWEGRAKGSVAGQTFDLPVTVEIGKPLPFEKNPFHLFLATKSAGQVGDFSLVSALEVGTGGPSLTYETGMHGVGVYGRTTGRDPGRGNVTLQYLAIERQGRQVTASLADMQKQGSSAANGFTGPNLSAREASDLMRGVHEALGPTEMFVFRRGAAIRLEFTSSGLKGTVTGDGRSVTNTSSDAPYRCTIEARRVK